MNDPLKSREWVAANILRESNVTDTKAHEYADELFTTLHASLRKPLADWWETGQYDRALSVEAWTVDTILANETTDCVWGAFTYLSGLMTHREETLQLLQVVNRRPSTITFSAGFRDKMRQLLKNESQ